MKLIISQLNEGENPFSFNSISEPWLTKLVQSITEKGYQFVTPLSTEFKLIKSEPDYFIKGKINFGIEQSCARCAESFALNIKHPFGVSLAHIASSRPQKAPEKDEETDLDINFFEGNEIDLAPILEEQFFLSLPYQSICSESCKGICQSCGQNLNEKLCGCSHKDLASPFSVLQHMHI